MNYDQARQIDPAAARPDAGKWHYTSMNDGRVHAIGYCSPIDTCPVCDGNAGIWSTKPLACSACDNKGYRWMENPCPGHDTADEAERHYYEWQADHLRETTMRPASNVADGRFLCEAMVLDAMHINGKPEGSGRRSKCERLTLNGLGIEGDMMDVAMLCDEHRNKEGWMSARPFQAGIMSIHS